MSKIISDDLLIKINNLRGHLAKIVIWTIVGIVGVGVIVILFFDNPWEVVGKFLGSMAILAVMLLVSIIDIRKAAIEQPSVQVLAMLGLVTNIIWAICWIVIVWVPELYVVEKSCLSGMIYDARTCDYPSVMTKIAMTASCLSFFGLVGAVIMSVSEGRRKQLMQPLKITAVVCLFYAMFHFSLITWLDYSAESEFMTRLSILSGFSWVVWIVLGIIVIAMTDSNNAQAARTVQPGQIELNGTMIDASWVNGEGNETESGEKVGEKWDDEKVNDEKVNEEKWDDEKRDGGKQDDEKWDEEKRNEKVEDEVETEKEEEKEKETGAETEKEEERKEKEKEKEAIDEDENDEIVESSNSEEDED